MKIEKRGVRITEVPGVQSIESVEEGKAFKIVFIGGNEYVWAPAGLAMLRDALTEALKAVGAEDPGPWMSLDDIPDSVTAVWDRDNDQLNRRSDGTWPEMSESWNKYAPFRAQR